MDLSRLLEPNNLFGNVHLLPREPGRVAAHGVEAREAAAGLREEQPAGEPVESRGPGWMSRQGRPG